MPATRLAYRHPQVGIYIYIHRRFFSQRARASIYLSHHARNSFFYAENALRFSDVAAAEARTAGAYVAAEVAEGGSLTPGGGSLLDQVRAWAVASTRARAL